MPMVLPDDTLQGSTFRAPPVGERTRFFADEIRIYERQLEELIRKSAEKDAMQELEQFPEPVHPPEGSAGYPAARHPHPRAKAQRG